MSDMDMPLIDEQTLETVEKLKQTFYELGVALQEIFSAYVDAFNEVVQSVRRAIQKADNLQRERFSWKHTYAEKPKDLLLDKRSGVYRCRNTI